MSWTDTVLEHPSVYRLWQAPFAASKLAPMLARTDLAAVRRVLDVGCGPGTNAPYFASVDYTGVDINARYIRYAQRRFTGRFLVADVTAMPSFDRAFDCVIVNSLLHHLATPDVRRLLTALRSMLSDDGYIHILELVLPPPATMADRLAKADRGQFSRSVSEWRALCGEVFAPIVVEPYTLGMFGVPLWHMIYFKGR